MSINTELARIKGAKADLQSWVEENGVTVPDGTLIDGLVELAKTVETGGGGEQSLGYATGTFIPERDTKLVVITHNLGRIPSFIFVYYTGTYSVVSNFQNNVISDLFATMGKQLMVRTYNKNYMIREYNITNFEGAGRPIQNANETTVRLFDSTQNDFYAQGFEYKWIMW